MLSQIFEKLGSGEKLFQEELMELKQWGNRLEQAENTLMGMVQPGGQVKLNSPQISLPQWENSPSHSFHFYLTTTNTSITINTWTTITFESSSGSQEYFGFYNNDKSKIKLYKFSVRMSGIVNWATNTSGDRIVRVNVFDKDDASLGTKELSNIPTSNTAGFGLKQGFNYVEDVRALFPTAEYMTFQVYQNAVDPLDMEDFVGSVGFG